MNKSIELMDTREKLIYLRKTLKTTQRALAGDTLTKEFISMVEGGKRNMSREVAITVMKNALNLANEKGIDLGLDEEYLTRSKEDDLCEICDKLDNTMENMENFNKIIEYAEENNYHWAKIVATKKIGNAYFRDENLNEAYKKYIQCLELIDVFKSNKFKEKIYNCIGNIKLKKLQYEEALIYYEEALNYCYINNTFTIKNSIQYNLAAVLHNIKDFDKSIKISEEVLSNNIGEALYIKLQMLKGGNYMENNSLEEALNIYNTISKSNLSDRLKGAVYGNIALCYMRRGQYDESEGYFDLAINITKTIPKMKCKVMLNKATMNREIGKIQEARKILKEGIELINITKDYEYKFKYLNELYLLEERDKNTEDMKKIVLEILKFAQYGKLNEEMVWARKKLIDIAMKENDLSILKEA